MVLRRTLVLRIEGGLHARPCALLAGQAVRARGGVRIRRGLRVADARSILELMSLMAGCGDELEIMVDRDEDAPVLDALADIVIRRSAD